MISKKKHNLIVCAGMVRSGSTLQYNIICRLLEIANISYEAYAKSAVEYANYSSHMPGKITIIKTHDSLVPPEIFDLYEVSIAYTFRDLRDVYLSGKEKCGWSTLEVLRYKLDKALLNYDHLKGYNQRRILYQPYESLYENISECVREACGFLGLQCGADVVAQVSREFSIEHVSHMIESNPSLKWNGRIRKFSRKLSPLAKSFFKKSRLVQGMWNALRGDLVDKKTMLHTNHISQRKGKPGLWREHLSNQEIVEIEQRYIDFMRDKGYL